VIYDTLARLSGLRLLRRIVLPTFERLNPGDIRVRHHYTKRRLLLHSYRHKGYWFHGRQREQSTMKFIQRAVRDGDTVIEVGGHIGYLSMLFADLVGDRGRVVVFEPGENNLPYLRANVGQHQNVEIHECAISDHDGTAPFFEEDLTGQNNSLVRDYEPFRQNRQLAFSKQKFRQRSVNTLRLDTFAAMSAICPNLIKIDIEGAEAEALSGALKLLNRHAPILMVEVTRRQSDVFRLLSNVGYTFFTPEGNQLANPENLNGNICAVHLSRHKDRLADWSLAPERAA
jgi:FkbM family methyltransferase